MVLTGTFRDRDSDQLTREHSVCGTSRRDEEIRLVIVTELSEPTEAETTRCTFSWCLLNASLSSPSSC